MTALNAPYVGVGRGRYSANRLPKGRKVYPAELVAAVRSSYESGRTILEVALDLGLTPKVVQRVIANHGIPTRRAIRRNQAGPANERWKGDQAGYAALHLRVQALRGTASLCDWCGTTEAKRYEWANLTGNYLDPDDYARLCVSCHRRYDNARRRECGSSHGA